MKNPGFHIVLFICLALFGCKKQDEATPTAYGYDFYPVEAGSFITYDVLEITYDDFFSPVKVDTLHYLIKQKIDSIVDDNGEPKFILSRYFSDIDTVRWNIIDVWQGRKTAKHLELVEENQNIIKLVFPIKINQQWDANANNTLNPEKYHYLNISNNVIIGNEKFDAVLTVFQRLESNLIAKVNGEEWYAKGIGMIYKKDLNIKTEVDGSIKSGYDRTFNLKSYGKE